MPVDRYEVAINVPRGPLTTSVDVPSGFVPIATIVPLARQLGEQASVEEVRGAVEEGATISCKDGCAACCRMMVPLSPPEAFALRDHIDSLPKAERDRFMRKIDDAKAALRHAGLLEPLIELAKTPKPLADSDMDALNHAYYALRLPCPFLEAGRCGIYEHRPSACRELLVTSPADLCQDLAHNAVQPLPVPIRVSTVLGLLWADLTDKIPRLIPLPLALNWATEHEPEGRRVWKGGDLLDQTLDKVWRLLSQTMGEKQC
ncbi:MAG: YkgJ family cysteine cluster protein [Nitrospirae bacterium]|nr:YkgJ family cysteine cluster protein [Nitrospirota bacterium]